MYDILKYLRLLHNPKNGTTRMGAHAPVIPTYVYKLCIYTV